MHDTHSGAVDEAFRTYQRTRSSAALAAVYDRTAARLLATAMHLCTTSNEAEDAVQDTFLFALEHPERWDSARPLEPWLLGILANRVREARARGARVPDVDRLTAVRELEPADLAANDELARAIDDAIEHLAQPYRSVVLLRLRNGLSPADIAIALDRNASTIRAQLTRGLQMLRKLLPAGVAAAVASLTPARGLAAVRETVVAHAQAAQRAFRWQLRLALLRRAAGFALGAAAATALVVLAISRDTPAAPLDLARAAATAGPDADEPEPDRVDVVRYDAGPPAAVRTAVPVAGRGALRVRVACRGVAALGALVDAEPLADARGVLLQRRSTSAFGSYAVAMPSRTEGASLRQTGATDAAGSCELDGLGAGPWLVRCAGGFAVVDVRPDTVAEHEFALTDDSCTVRGTVLDAAGAPVPDAEVWICSRREAWFASTVAHTGRDGRFVVTAGDYATVGARAPGKAPVALTLGATQGREREVVLRLEHAGGALAGSVVDGDGRPVPGAEVQVGHACDSMAEPSEHAAVNATPVRVRADADGRFAVDALVPGEVVVAARAPGFGTARTTARVSAGAAAAITVALEPAASVHGVVTDASGRPVADALVQVGDEGDLGRVATQTDAAGTYRLDGVAPGRACVFASDLAGAVAGCSLDVTPGASLEWAPSLRVDGLTLQGCVLRPDGTPLADAFVCRATGGLTAEKVVRTDAGGRFSCTVPESERTLLCWLGVFDHDPLSRHDAPRSLPLAVAGGIRVGATDLVIRMSDDRFATGSLSGRVLDAVSRPPREALTLRDAELGWTRALEPAKGGAPGAFDSGPIPPGRYEIVVGAKPDEALGPFAVAPSARVDVGTLLLAAPAPATPPAEPERAREIVFLHPHDGTPSCGLGVEVRDAEARVVERRRLHPSRFGDWRAKLALPAGSYRVDARAATGLRGATDLVVSGGDAAHRPLLVVMQKE